MEPKVRRGFNDSMMSLPTSHCCECSDGAEKKLGRAFPGRATAIEEAVNLSLRTGSDEPYDRMDKRIKM